MASSQQLLPGYLIVGEDDLKREEVLRRLEQHIDEEAQDFNLIILDAGIQQVDVDEVVTLLNTMPFMSDLRIVIIKDAHKLDKASSEQIIAYIADPSPTSVLALSCEKLAKNTRLYKAFNKLGSQSVIACDPIKRYQLPDFLVKSARERYTISLEPRAAELLVSRCGESARMLFNELEKLIEMHPDSLTITFAMVDTYVAQTAEVKPWDFLDALAERDISRALKLYQSMTSPNLMGLYTLALSRVRELLTAQSLSDRQMFGQLAQELGLQQWQVKNHQRWIRNYTGEELVALLRSAAICEQKLKSSSDKDGAFVEWICLFARSEFRS